MLSKVQRRIGRLKLWLSFGLAAVLLALVFRGPIRTHGVRPPVALLPGWSGTALQQVVSLPIERKNFFCAQGLEEPDFDSGQVLAELSAWTDRVRSETERHGYRFRRNPGEFEHSEGFFKMLMLAVVLAEDFGVHYTERLKRARGQSGVEDGFFSQPEDVFLHGLLGRKRQGTCSSMPVLYAAIGRRLGYPLKLVTTRGHLFLRWDGTGERFNIEATSLGLSRFDDDYYRHWPFELAAGEEAAEGYLKSLSPAEELAVFLSIRGMCQRESDQVDRAIESFAAATRLAPQCAGYRRMMEVLRSRQQRFAGR
jgi:hypothetical protein